LLGTEETLGKELGKTEIEHLRLAALGHKYISGFDVAMDDALNVCGIERIRDLDTEIQELLQRERLAVNVMAQGIAVDELHGDERLAVLLANVINSADVRVVEGGSGMGFSAEAFEGQRILPQIFWKKFQGDCAVEAHILSLEDHAHTASAKSFQDAVVRDGFANHREHWL